MNIIGIYLRLSLEDKKDSRRDESNSISSQRLLIRDFIRQDAELKEYEIKEFCDDGWSGTGLDRPGMNQLLAEVKKNRIQCIIVKDMSRFSRDYIEMGTYLNQIFPFMGIRFIALCDHYDSRKDKGSVIEIDTAFRTLLYDLYSKDISVKVKASIENKCANGEYVFGQVPFGYGKSPVEKNKVITNKEEAEIVQHIFSLAMQQKSSAQIARQLCREGIPTIMQLRQHGREQRDGRAHTWSASAVRNILNNRFYLGEMVYGKTVCKSVGSKNSVAVPKEEWKVIPNHHEALVTQEIYEQASSFRSDHVADRKREKHPLTGKLYCGGCGYAMVYKPLRGKNRYRRFECSKHALLQIPECCTYFPADVLEELVLTMVNKELLVKGEAARQEKSLQMLYKNRLADVKDQMVDLQREQEQMKYSQGREYEKYAAGEVTAEEYRRRADELSRQTKLLAGQMDGLQEKFSALEEEQGKLDADMKQVIRYSHMEKFTQDLVYTFIERIYIYKNKRVEIKWKFK